MKNIKIILLGIIILLIIGGFVGFFAYKYEKGKELTSASSSTQNVTTSTNNTGSNNTETNTNLNETTNNTTENNS